MLAQQLAIGFALGRRLVGWRLASCVSLASGQPSLRGSKSDRNSTARHCRLLALCLRPDLAAYKASISRRARDRLLGPSFGEISRQIDGSVGANDNEALVCVGCLARRRRVAQLRAAAKRAN